MTDSSNVGARSQSAPLRFSGTNNITGDDSNFTGTINTNFTGITTTVNNTLINLDVNITNGLANPEINKTSGDIIFIDNRPLVTRNSRQKEDIKIILEF